MIEIRRNRFHLVGRMSVEIEMQRGLEIVVVGEAAEVDAVVAAVGTGRSL